MPITRKELEKELSSGMSQRAIAAKYGVSASAVSQRVKKLGQAGGRSLPAGRSVSERSSAQKGSAPSLEVIGVSGGSRVFTGRGDNETYNPDTISIDTYRKMTFDAQISAGMTVLKLPVQNAEWSIKCGNTEISEFVQANFETWWDLFMESALTALDFGFAAFEKRWEYVDGKYLYKHPLDLLPESITILQNKDSGDFEGIKQKVDYKSEVTIPAPKSFIFTNYKGRSFGNLYGISRLKAAYRFWYAARYNYDFANTFFETFSSPLVKGFAPKGTTDIRDSAGNKKGEVNNIDVMLDIIKNLRLRSAASLPWSPDKRWDIEFMEAKRTGGDFVEYIRYLDLMKIRAIFVPDLVLGQGGERGSYALGKVHMRMFLKTVDAVLSTLKFHIDRFLIPQLVEYNFPGFKEPVTWIFEPPSKEDRETLEAIFIDLVKQGKVSTDNMEIAERLGVPMLSEEEQDGEEDDAEEQDTEEQDTEESNNSTKEDSE